MKTKTATIERIHLYGTIFYYLALFSKGKDYSPGYMHGEPDMVPCDAEGIETLKKQAKKLGFSHIKFNGWSEKYKPKGGKL